MTKRNHERRQTWSDCKTLDERAVSSMFMMACRVSAYDILMRAMAMDVFMARLPSRRQISFGTSFFTSFFFDSSSCRTNNDRRPGG